MTKKKKPDQWTRLMEEYGFINFESVLAKVAVQSDPNASIRYLRPHYTNEAFRSPQTVYLAKGHKLSPEYVKGAEYFYSDHLHRQYYEGVSESRKEAREKFPTSDSAAQEEAYLRALMEKPNLRLVHIMAGFNVSNGFDYQVYGVIFDETTNS